MMGNRHTCRGIAEQFGIDWHMTADEQGVPRDEEMLDLLDQYQVDYVVLARYMRILPPATCWKYAGGRIINLHHGLLPSFPGPRPYHDAFAARMLTYGATCHFIVPELDAGKPDDLPVDLHDSPGMKLDDIIRIGQEDNEPRCLVEGVRRVVDREIDSISPSRGAAMKRGIGRNRTPDPPIVKLMSVEGSAFHSSPDSQIQGVLLRNRTDATLGLVRPHETIEPENHLRRRRLLILPWCSSDRRRRLLPAPKFCAFIFSARLDAAVLRVAS